jgi:hypothetical protein
LDIEEGGKGKEAHCCLRAPPLVWEEIRRPAPLRRVSLALGHWLRVWRRSLARKIFMWDWVQLIRIVHIANSLPVSGRSCKSIHYLCVVFTWT